MIFEILKSIVIYGTDILYTLFIQTLILSFNIFSFPDSVITQQKIVERR